MAIPPILHCRLSGVRKSRAPSNIPSHNLSFTHPVRQNIRRLPLCCQSLDRTVSNLVRNVPFVTSLEVSPFLFWFLLFFSSLAWPRALSCGARRAERLARSG